MKRYIFAEQVILDEYKYIFLCGSHYTTRNKKDKRNILRDFLKKKSLSYCPIILEDNFIFKKSQSRFLLYDDIFMKNLYQVEMVMNYLSDNNIIIHESISTGAETGLFLSEESSVNKTCLLIPDKMAIEDNKLGQFIRLAFLRKPKAVEVIKFYPRIEKNIISNDVRYWHTYFWKDRVGTNLGNKIISFLEKEDTNHKIKFTRKKEKVKQGFIHYKKNKNMLLITLVPRVLSSCIATIFNINELSRKVFNTEERELKEYIKDIKECLLKVFIQTIEEKTGDDFESCRINIEMNASRVYISGVIGMILYLFQAAGFIEIVKAEDYVESNKVKIKKKMIMYDDGIRHFFYEKYKNCIKCAIDTQIV